MWRSRKNGTITCHNCGILWAHQHARAMNRQSPARIGLGSCRESPLATVSSGNRASCWLQQRSLSRRPNFDGRVQAIGRSHLKSMPSSNAEIPYSERFLEERKSGHVRAVRYPVRATERVRGRWPRHRDLPTCTTAVERRYPQNIFLERAFSAPEVCRFTRPCHHPLSDAREEKSKRGERSLLVGAGRDGLSLT